MRNIQGKKRDGSGYGHRHGCGCNQWALVPLAFQEPGKTYLIQDFRGGPGMRRHLNDLGLIPGDEITIMSETSSGLIVVCKGCKMAMNRGLAQHILTETQINF